MLSDGIAKLLRLLASEGDRARLCAALQGGVPEALRGEGIDLHPDIVAMLGRVNWEAYCAAPAAPNGAGASRFADQPRQWGVSDKAEDVDEYGVRLDLPSIDAVDLIKWCRLAAEQARASAGSNFIRLFLLKYAGDPAQYLCLSAWKTIDAAASFLTAPDYQGLKQDLDGLAGASVPPRRFTVVAENVSPLHQAFPVGVSDGFTLIEEWMIKDNVHPMAFAESRFILQQDIEAKCEGFLRGLVASFVDEPHHFLVTFTYVSEGLAGDCPREEVIAAREAEDPSSAYAEGGPRSTTAWTTLLIDPPIGTPRQQVSGPVG